MISFGLENPVLIINCYTQGKDGFEYTYSLVARSSPTRCRGFWIATEKKLTIQSLHYARG